MSDESDRFATPRVAAGVLIRDAEGRILLVKPTYKNGWEIPGGYVERGESPLAAAVREVHEELGVDLDVTELLVLDWAPHPAEGDKLLFIFRGPTITADQINALNLDPTEIGEAKLFDVDALYELMPDRLARRVAAAAAQASGTYLEHGAAVS